MATYVVGDLQGCLSPLLRLLDKVSFSAKRDKLWFVGDLVNRGPESLECLEFVKSLGDSAITVLGNHDLHLLAVFEGVREPSSKDTLAPIIQAPNASDLCQWLSQQPLIHTDPSLGFTLVHAGIHPHWTLSQAIELAGQTCQSLQKKRKDFLQRMYGNKPSHWKDIEFAEDLMRFTINVLTRMRYCNESGELDYHYKGPPHAAPSHLYPWHSLPGRKVLPTCVVFGHWSSHPTLGSDQAIPTDMGCVWGGCLGAYAIEQQQMHWVSCAH